MTAPVAEVLACHYCGAEQPASGLIQPFAFGTPVGRVVCKDGDACLARIDAGSLPERPVIATEPHPEPLRDISGDLLAIPPNRIVEPEPISGRMEPRPAPLPPGFEHDVRWDADEQGIYGQCLPCGPEKHHLEGGRHRAAAFAKFERQHAGIEDGAS